MSTIPYQNELTSLVSEAKRKYPDVRNAAEKALQNLKSITITSEQQLTADLRQRTDFVDAFLKACTTLNPRLAVSGVTGLQRLVTSQGLPVSRLDETLQAFNTCAQLGLDIQLKVLQALPSLVQNYSDELHGDLLGGALQVCAALQGAKVSTISAVAAATLQQLVASVITRVIEEDARGREVAFAATVPGEDGNVEVRPAAYDAYRVFRDLVLAAEGRSTQFVQLSTLSKEDCLELIASCIAAKPQLITTHEELSWIVRSRVIGLVTSCLTDNLSFTVTVRCIRVLRMSILRYFNKYQAELEPAISLFAHTMEAETSPMWRRVLVMELLRDMFHEHSLVIKAYMAFDQAEEPKSVIQDIFAAFVRLSSEKPAVIGLGQQSSVPTGPPATREPAAEQLASDPVGGMTGMFTSLGVLETNVQGISSVWSVPKTACYDQLDKGQAPSLPETYIYSLVLDCLNGLADALAKIVLPLTVHQKGHADDKHDSDHEQSLPLNPMNSKTPSPAVHAVASLVESCWPAVLATCSTFMNAALDDGYYRALIKAYQRFAQVAGLLRLTTPRDALMTTLGKAAVPPQAINAMTSEATRSPVPESPRIFSNTKSLLSIESLVSQASSFTSDKERRSSSEQTKVGLTVRNLLCLRALLNLAIALGPTLEYAYSPVIQVLRQADIILSSASPQQLLRVSTSSSQSDPPSIVQSFSSEVSAVEAAASRLLESAADYPDGAFCIVLHAFGDLLRTGQIVQTPSVAEEPTSNVPVSPRRTASGLPGLSSQTNPQMKNYQFVLPKLNTLAELNVSRFVSRDADASGWMYLMHEMVSIAASNLAPANARRAAVSLVCKLAAECIAEVIEEDVELRKLIQDRSLSILLQVIIAIYDEEAELTSGDLEVQSHITVSIKVILEQSGDSLLAGWDKVTAILSSAFDFENGMAILRNPDVVRVEWSHLTKEFISLRLGREAFAAFQLLVADFFTLLPTASTAAAIELVFRFMSQSEDLNLSLTAISLSWNIADLLLTSLKQDVKLPVIRSELEAKHFETQLSSLSISSQSAQWILLLIKLRQIVQHGDREMSKAAFQTLCNIAKAAGAQLPTDVWAIVLRHILIGVLADDSASDLWQGRALTANLLDGVAEVMSQQFLLISRLPKLTDTWHDLVGILETFLTRQDLESATAVYRALAKVLSHADSSSEAWDDPVSAAVVLWSKYEPSQYFATHEENQTIFRAYTDLATQLLRLQDANMDEAFAADISSNLAACVRTSVASTYNADAQVLSPLQTQVLTLLQAIPDHVEDVLTNTMNVAVEFAMLHTMSTKKVGRPSFVALCMEALSWLEKLILQHVREPAVTSSAAIERALKCLADIIEEKYTFQTGHKDKWLWQEATRAAIAVAGPVLHMATDGSDDDLSQKIWHQYVRITSNVVCANGLQTFGDEQRSHLDERKDIEFFRKLEQALIPGLGDDSLTNEEVTIYVRAVFEASIIHPLESTEILMVDQMPLSRVSSTRHGRVKKIVPSRREDMCYECLAHLVKLCSSSENSVSQHHRLAKAAAPLLILRLAIPIRAYIVDQPLRSRSPQPLSELEELMYCFRQIAELRIEQSALGSETAHVRYLYPLLVKAVRVAGDKWCGSREVLDPLQQSLEALVVQ